MSEETEKIWREVDVIEEIFQLAKDVGDFACGLRPYVEEENCTKEAFIQREAQKYKDFCVEDLSKRCPALFDHLYYQKMGQEAAHYLVDALTCLRSWCTRLKEKQFSMEEYKEVHHMAQDFLRIQCNLLCYLYFYCELYEESEGILSSMDQYCKRCNLSVFDLAKKYENFFPPHPDQWTVKEILTMGKFSHLYPNAFYFAGNHDIMPKLSEMELCLEDGVEEWNLLEELKSMVVDMYEDGDLDIEDEEELEELLQDDDASLSFYLWSDYIWTSL